jgi:hypothetical protein
MRIPRPARLETTAWSAATLASTAHPPVPQFYARGDVELDRDRRFDHAVIAPILVAANRQADLFSLCCQPSKAAAAALWRERLFNLA